MKESKKYRTDWTIAPDESRGHGIMWYKYSIDMDNVYYCNTIEEAEREIDDAIITEQDRTIDALRTALDMSTKALKHAQNLISDEVDFRSSYVDSQIEYNGAVLRACESN